MSRSRMLLLSALAALLVAHPAMANGIDLPKQAGKPGERIEVGGHDWLTCCPSSTPVEHVELFLLTDGERLLLFDVPANDEGEIRAAFEVPSLPPASYRLEACSRGPELPGIAPGATCLPEEVQFTILPGEAGAGGGLPVTTWLGIGVGITLSLALAVRLIYRRAAASGRLR